MRFAIYGMVFWISLRACTERAVAQQAVRLFALFSTGLAAFGIYAWVSGDNIILGDQAGRALSASFVNRNSYATFAVFGILANLAVYTHRQRGAQGSREMALRDFLEGFFSGGWLWAFGMLLCAGAAMMTQSRAGAVAVVLGLATFLLTHRSAGRGGANGLIAMVVGGGLIVAMTAAGGLADRLLSGAGEEGRFLVYPKIVEGIMDRPLLGHGLGAFEDAFRAYVPFEAARGEWNMAHNSYLENAFELGLVGAGALYLALLLVVLRIWRGRVESRSGHSLQCFAFSCAVAAGFHAAFDFSLQMPALAASFAFILGLGYAQSIPKPKRKTSRQT